MIELPYHPVTEEEMKCVDALQAGMQDNMRDFPWGEMRDTHFAGMRLILFPTTFFPEVNYTGIGSCTPLLNRYRVRQGEEVLDVGTGSGVIAIDAAYKGAKRVIALDINEGAIRSTQRNAQLHRCADRVDVRLSDVFHALKPEESFDVITANLPFRNKPATDVVEAAVWDTDFRFHREFFTNVQKYLKPDGRVYLAQANFGGVEEALELAKRAGLESCLLGYTAMASDEERKTNPNYDPRVFYCFEMRRK